jgi:hypothetical protein
MKGFLVSLSLLVYSSQGFSAATGASDPTPGKTEAETTSSPTPTSEKEASKGPYKGTCLYGGWPSSYDDGCNSPTKLTDYKSLKSKVNNKSICTGEDKFLCNPVTFGTTCVPLSPSSTLTKRCEETSRKLYHNSGVQGMAKDFMKDFSSMEGDELFMGTSVALSELCKKDSDYVKHLKAKGGASEGLVKDCETHSSKLEEIRKYIGLNSTAVDAGELLNALNSGGLPAAMTKGACGFEEIDRTKYGELLSKYDKSCKPKKFTDPLYSSGAEATNSQNLYTAFSQIVSTGCVDSVNGGNSSETKVGDCSIDVSSLYAPTAFGGLDMLQSSFKAKFQGKYSGDVELSLQNFGATSLSAHAWKEKIYEKNPELAKACGWGKTENDKLAEDAQKILDAEGTEIVFDNYGCTELQAGALRIKTKENPDGRCLDSKNPLDAKILEMHEKKVAESKKEESKPAAAAATSKTKDVVSDDDLKKFDKNQDGKIDETEYKEIEAQLASGAQGPALNGQDPTVKKEIMDRYAGLNNAAEYGATGPLLDNQKKTSSSPMTIGFPTKGSAEGAGAELASIEMKDGKPTLNKDQLDTLESTVGGIHKDKDLYSWDAEGKKYVVDKKSGELRIVEPRAAIPIPGGAHGLIEEGEKGEVQINNRGEYIFDKDQIAQVKSGLNGRGVVEAEDGKKYSWNDLEGNSYSVDKVSGKLTIAEDKATEETSKSRALAQVAKPQYESAVTDTLTAGGRDEMLNELSSKGVKSNNGVYEWVDEAGVKHNFNSATAEHSTSKPVKLASTSRGIDSKKSAVEPFTSIQQAYDASTAAKFVDGNTVEFADGKSLALKFDKKIDSGMEYYTVSPSETEKVKELFEKNGFQAHGKSMIDIGGAQVHWNNGVPKVIRPKQTERKFAKVHVHVGEVSGKVESNQLTLGETKLQAEFTNKSGQLVFSPAKAQEIRRIFSSYPNYEKANSFHISNMGSIQFKEDGTVVFVKN